jgi:hypothetical protein
VAPQFRGGQAEALHPLRDLVHSRRSISTLVAVLSLSRSISIA